jgi:hypothetical protein
MAGIFLPSSLRERGEEQRRHLMTAMHFRCPSCGRVMRPDRPLAPGTRVKCPQCGKPVRVPEARPVLGLVVVRDVAGGKLCGTSNSLRNEAVRNEALEMVKKASLEERGEPVLDVGTMCEPGCC